MEKKKYKPTILIDLDGVLNEYTKYEPNFIPPVKQGAKEFLEELYEEYELILFTTRNLLLAGKWLCENSLDGYFKDITNVKLPAVLCVDDRVVCFRGDFKYAIRKIKEFKVYWKNI